MGSAIVYLMYKLGIDELVLGKEIWEDFTSKSDKYSLVHKYDIQENSITFKAVDEQTARDLLDFFTDPPTSEVN